MTDREANPASLGFLRRRTVLVGGGALVLTGCAGGGSGAGGDRPNGTAIIGLRIGESASLRTLRDSVPQPWSLFDRERRPPSAEISFGYIEPETGGIDLPILPAYSGKMAEVKTEGYTTTFEAVELTAGRYATIRALLFTGAKIIYDLRFSAGGNRLVAPDEIGGYAFALPPGEVIYVGTLVLALGAGLPRIVEEFEAAAAAFPDLARVGRDRGYRPMEHIGPPRSKRG